MPDDKIDKKDYNQLFMDLLTEIKRLQDRPIDLGMAIGRCDAFQECATAFLTMQHDLACSESLRRRVQITQDFSKWILAMHKAAFDVRLALSAKYGLK